MQMIWFCVSTRCRKYRTIDWLLDYSRAQKYFCAFLFSVPHRYLREGLNLQQKVGAVLLFQKGYKT